MNNQLSNISTQYRKFSKGQYIEHTQFNEFLDFFEDQDRLSRVMLQGVGIVCGFEPQLIYSGRIPSIIQLSQGVAITTDGDLLILGNTSKVSGDLYVSDLKTIDIENKQYTHFKVYDDYKVMYPAFHEDEDQIELWELATSSEVKAGFQPIAGLGSLEDKYLLLYLETYEKEVKPCRGVDCDNHGIQQIRNLKVLVTTRDGVDHIFKNDKIYPHPTLSGLGIDRKLKRVILEPEATSIESLIQSYKKVVISDSHYGAMFRDIDLISTILTIPLVDRENFIEILNDLSSQDRGFQYAYDVMKDLFDTYTELIRLLPKSFTKCLPDLLSFPKHIMLGKLISNTKLDYTRHQFYNSPILDSEKTTRRVELLIERFNQLTLQFKNPLEDEKEVKITPSQELRPLGEEAIPFYYDLTEGFIKAWDFNKTSNRKSNTNLSFDTTLLSEDLHIQKSLEYNIDKKSFFRIEGHQGMDYQTAVEDIRKINHKLQLGCDVMALSLQELEDNKDLSKAYFAEYVEKNPGLEHLGGVRRGGTFGVVYASENDRTVIADFSLPYICCTPKSDVKLSLPSNVICEKAERILFTVSPLNGVVEADVANESKGCVVFSNGQYFFDPKFVAPSLHNQEIAFTVNGKPTNCTIKVISQPDIQVNVRAIIYPEDASVITEVTFAVSGENATNYDYSWDFLGNGNYVDLKPNAQGEVTHKYYNLDVENIPVIQVRISSDGCSQNVIRRDWYVPETVEIHIPPVANAGSDQAVYLPDNSVKLYGSGTRGDSDIVSYFWTSQESVPILYPSLASTGVTFSSPGTYTFKLTVTDGNNLTGTDFVTITVGTKARVTGVSISPVSPNTQDTVSARATISNPSNIQNLKYGWYLDGEFQEETSSDIRSFGALTVGDKTIEVGLVSSAGNNHVTDKKSVSFAVTSKPATGGSSFLAGTLIRMANGTVKKVEEIRLGDELRGSQGTVNVIDMSNYQSDSKLYRLNEEEFFITAEHPVMTDGGWKSFDPNTSKLLVPSISVGLLKRNDILFQEDGKREALNNEDFREGKNLVYNFSVDKTNDFYANGYLVHNKIEHVDDPR